MSSIKYFFFCSFASLCIKITKSKIIVALKFHGRILSCVIIMFIQGHLNPWPSFNYLDWIQLFHISPKIRNAICSPQQWTVSLLFQPYYAWFLFYVLKDYYLITNFTRLFKLVTTITTQHHIILITNNIKNINTNTYVIQKSIELTSIYLYVHSWTVEQRLILLFFCFPSNVVWSLCCFCFSFCNDDFFLSAVTTRARTREWEQCI